MIKQLLNKYQPCQFNVNAILLSDLINYVDNEISNRVKVINYGYLRKD